CIAISCRLERTSPSTEPTQKWSRSPSGSRTDQHPNQLSISWRKIQIRKFLSRHPAHLLPKQRRWVAARFALEKVQLDASIRIIVRDREDFRPDRHLDPELLVELTSHARGQRLSVVSFPAGKLPDTSQVGARLAARHKIPTVAQDDCGCDDNRLHDDVS